MICVGISLIFPSCLAHKTSIPTCRHFNGQDITKYKQFRNFVYPNKFSAFKALILHCASKDQNTLRSTSISIGLWTVKACVTKSYLYSFETSCGSMKTAEFIHAIDASNRSATVKEHAKNFLLAFYPQKIFTLFGVITTLSGIISIFVYIWKTSKMTASFHRSTGIYCILSWIISAVLVLTAVGIQLRQNAEVKKEACTTAAMSEVKKLLTVPKRSPTALILSGVGGALGILLAVTVTLLMLFKSKSGPHQSGFRTLQNNETYDDEAHEDLCSDTIDRSSMTV